MPAVDPELLLRVDLDDPALADILDDDGQAELYAEGIASVICRGCGLHEDDCECPDGSTLAGGGSLRQDQA